MVINATTTPSIDCFWFGFALLFAIPGVIGPFQRPAAPSSPAQRIPSILSHDLTPKHRARFSAATPNTPPRRTGSPG